MLSTLLVQYGLVVSPFLSVQADVQQEQAHKPKRKVPETTTPAGKKPNDGSVTPVRSSQRSNKGVPRRKLGDEQDPLPTVLE